MKRSWSVGLCFGLTTGVIATLGLMIGLYSGTHSRLVVLGGILTIAVADALADALGIHVSQESENRRTDKAVWEATASTFLSKIVIASTFAVPVLLLELSTAIIVSAVWGLLLLGLLSYFIALKERKAPWKVVSEHLAIAVIVIIVNFYLGAWIATVFG